MLNPQHLKKVPGTNEIFNKYLVNEVRRYTNSSGFSITQVQFSFKLYRLLAVVDIGGVPPPDSLPEVTFVSAVTSSGFASIAESPYSKIHPENGTSIL